MAMLTAITGPSLRSVSRSTGRLSRTPPSTSSRWPSAIGGKSTGRRTEASVAVDQAAAPVHLPGAGHQVGADAAELPRQPLDEGVGAERPHQPLVGAAAAGERVGRHRVVAEGPPPDELGVATCPRAPRRRRRSPRWPRRSRRCCSRRPGRPGSPGPRARAAPRCGRTRGHRRRPGPGRASGRRAGRPAAAGPRPGRRSTTRDLPGVGRAAPTRRVSSGPGRGARPAPRRAGRRPRRSAPRHQVGLRGVRGGDQDHLVGLPHAARPASRRRCRRRRGRPGRGRARPGRARRRRPGWGRRPAGAGPARRPGSSATAATGAAVVRGDDRDDTRAPPPARPAGRPRCAAARRAGSRRPARPPGRCRAGSRSPRGGSRAAPSRGGPGPRPSGPRR